MKLRIEFLNKKCCRHYSLVQVLSLWHFFSYQISYYPKNFTTNITMEIFKTMQFVKYFKQANRENPNLIAPRSSLICICTVFLDLSYQIFGINLWIFHTCQILTQHHSDCWNFRIIKCILQFTCYLMYFTYIWFFSPSSAKPACKI